MHELTTEQTATLAEYIRWAGEGWKKRLSRDWYRAGSQFPGEWAYLQQIRNRHGPEWLADYEHKEE